MKKVRLALFGVYRIIRSVLIPDCCRFYPSCSQYAEEALDRHPFSRASRMILGRLLRCHPFHPGGYDPVVIK